MSSEQQQGQQITSQSGSNLAISFSFLDAERRRAMSVFYAFCRVVDDIADSTTLSRDEKLRQLEEWRNDIHLCYTSAPVMPLARELAPVLKRYLIPPSYLFEIIDGVTMDLHNTLYETWAELEQYCYRVASVVGLVSIEIFGYQHPNTRKFAELLGLAFQTTNILRDVRTDLSYDRIYLPQEDFDRVGYSREELRAGKIDERALRLFRLMAERSEHFYAAAERILPEGDRGSMLAAQVMRGVYYPMLQDIRANGCDPWTRPLKYNKLKKFWLMRCAVSSERKPRKALKPQRTVTVIGGGFAGVSAAVELARRGHRVTLLESRPTLGGRTHSFKEPKSGDVVDNGQHIFMGCYRATLRLLEVIGSVHLLRVPRALDVPYVSEKKGLTRLRAPQLPAPLHLLGAVSQFEELTLGERLAAGKVGLSAMLDADGKRWRKATVENWLRSCGQSDNAIRALWEPVCIAALNEPVSSASASLFGEVIRRAFFRDAADSTVIFSRVGLSDLFARQAADIISACGGQVRPASAVRSVEFEGKQARALLLESGERLESDAIISAVPWHALRRLLPEGSALAEKVSAIKGAPIIGIHLWFDRPVLNEPFVGFLDSPIQWVFNRNAITEKGTVDSAAANISPAVTGAKESFADAEAQAEVSYKHSIAVVLSAAYEFLDSSSEELVNLAILECHRLLPSSREARLQHHFVYRARDATFQACPETLDLRPGAVTEWENFYLAGDWTDTGLPATIEGAVLSGIAAADAVG